MKQNSPLSPISIRRRTTRWLQPFALAVCCLAATGRAPAWTDTLDSLLYWNEDRTTASTSYFWKGSGSYTANIKHTSGVATRVRCELVRRLYTFPNNSAAATSKPGEFAITFNVPNHTDQPGEANRGGWIMQVMAWSINNSAAPGGKKYCPLVVLSVENGRLYLYHYREWKTGGVDAWAPDKYDLNYTARGTGSFIANVRIKLTTGNDGYVQARVGTGTWIGQSTGRTLDPAILPDAQNPNGYTMVTKIGSYSAHEPTTYFSKVDLHHVYYTWPYLTK